MRLEEGASRFHRSAVDLLTPSEKKMRRLRGGTIADVPQAALSRNGRCGCDIHEAWRAHEFGRNAGERDAGAAQVLSEVGLHPRAPAPGSRTSSRAVSSSDRHRHGVRAPPCCDDPVSPPPVWTWPRRTSCSRPSTS
ncbi:hypothetical protein QJS66_10510 [Kocuria rhizophila]|nr:hypothetical protein QJS66_10510 [Kocuria rhizophila]